MLTLAAIDPSIFIALITTLLSGGLIGGIVAFRKAGKETESLAVNTMAAVNSELRKQIRSRDDELKERDEEIKKLRERVAVLEDLMIRKIERRTNGD